MGPRAPRRVAIAVVAVVLGGGLVGGPGAWGATNDNFGQEEDLGAVSHDWPLGNTTGATKEPGEPNHAGASGGTSVWYRWRAPDNGSMSADTCQMDVKTVIAVYTGTTLASLQHRASNNDAPECPGGPSRVTLPVTLGVTYWIAVDSELTGTGPTVGKFMLHVDFGRSPDLASQPAGPKLLPDLRAGVPSELLVNTSDTGQKQLAFDGQVENHGVGPLELTRYQDPSADDCNNNGDALDDVLVKQNIFYDGNGNGTFDRGIDSGGESRIAGCMAHHQAHSHTHFEKMAGYTLVNEQSGQVVATASKRGFCLVDGDRHSPLSPGSPQDYYYALGSCSGIQGVSVGWEDVYGTILEGQQMPIDGVGAGTYCLGLTIDPAGQVDEANETNNTTAIRISLDPSNNSVSKLPGPCPVSTPSGEPPPNDDFSDAQTIPTDTGPVDGSTFGATKEAGEPAHAGNAGGSSVWYRWQAPEGEPVLTEVSTCGSSFDTLLAVYQGNSVDAASLTPIAANDDVLGEFCPLQSETAFTTVPGAVYRIAVDGFNNGSDTSTTSQGDVSLSVSYDVGPSNNNFSGAEDIPSVLPTTVHGTNEGATKEIGEPSHAANVGGASVWYHHALSGVTATQIAMETCGSDFDTLLAVYTGASIGFLVEVASNDDAGQTGCGLQSGLVFTVPAGTTDLYIAVDGFNNGTGPAQGSIELSIDQRESNAPPPPNTVIDAGPPDPTSDTTPTFTFSSDPSGGTFECRFDTGFFAGCTSPHTSPTELSDGAHVFEVRARDAAGIVDPSPAYRTLVVDTRPPDTRISFGPPAIGNDPRPSFDISSSELPATFECRLDANDFQRCGSSYDAREDLADGDHTFEASARDAAGNLDPTPVVYTFTIDTRPPETAIVEGPTHDTNDSTPTISFNSDEGNTSFLCRYDDQAFGSCSGPMIPAGGAHTPPTPLSDGVHAFEVFAIDAAGNIDATPATHTVTIDTHAPVASIDSGPEGWTNDNTPTFTFSADEDNVGFLCVIKSERGDENFEPCSGPGQSHTPPVPLEDGAYFIIVVATDEANDMGPPARRGFNVDTSPPNTSIDSGPSTSGPPTTDATPTFGFSSTEPDTTYECRFNSDAFAPCSGPGGSHTPTSNLRDGTHTFQVRATDQAGNTDPTAAERRFTIASRRRARRT